MRLDEGARPPARGRGLPLSKPSPIPPEVWAAWLAMRQLAEARGLVLGAAHASLVGDGGAVVMRLELRYAPPPRAEAPIQARGSRSSG